jgi:hypothetical protein
VSAATCISLRGFKNTAKNLKENERQVLGFSLANVESYTLWTNVPKLKIRNGCHSCYLYDFKVSDDLADVVELTCEKSAASSSKSLIKRCGIRHSFKCVGLGRISAVLTVTVLIANSNLLYHKTVP